MTIRAHAIEVEEYFIEAGTRYDRVGQPVDALRLQGEVRVALQTHLVERLELGSVLSTGPSYTSEWATIHDYRGGEPDPFELFFRHLYLQRFFGPVRAQVGTIPPVKNAVSSTGLEALGWLDGARVEYRHGTGVIEGVVGALRDLDNPNTFTRDKAVNFYEIEITQTLSRMLGAELSVERLDGESYVRSELRWTDKRTEAFAEGLWNATNRRAGTNVGAELDVLGLWGGSRMEGRLRALAYYTYMHPRIGLRGELADDFHTFGHAGTLKLSGLVDRDEGIGWFSKIVVADTPRFTLGARVVLEEDLRELRKGRPPPLP